MKEKIKDSLDYIRDLPKYFKSGIGVSRIIEHFKKVAPLPPDPVYPAWIAQNEPTDLDALKLEADKLKRTLKISVIYPIGSLNETIIKESLNSLVNQIYPATHLYIAVAQDLKDKLDPEIFKAGKVISEETLLESVNQAFEMVNTEYTCLLSEASILSPNALLEVAKAIKKDSKIDFLYVDEDKLSQEGVRKEPLFKSDYAPDSLLSFNYIGDFLVFRTYLIKDKLLRDSFEGALYYDLILRLVEEAKNIGHIPHVLNHVRDYQELIFNKTSEAGVLAIDEALRRRNLSGHSFASITPEHFHLRYDLKDESKKVSVIIPTKDNPGDIETCVKSIVQHTDYPNYEIIIINNNSSEQKTFEMFDKLSKEVDNLTVYDLPIPFNYSRINNYACRKATGDFYLFLNDDTKVITDGWMREMVSFAQQPWIGAVGAKLFYPDHTIQHAGVVVGFMGIAGHIYSRYPSSESGNMARLKHIFNYSAVTAACMMVEKDKFWQVDGFDENSAVAYNDVDLCLKLVDAGYYNIYLPQVELYHFESKSRGYETTAEKTLRFEKEKARIRMKWRDLLDYDPMYNPNLTLYRGDFTLDT